MIATQRMPDMGQNINFSMNGKSKSPKYRATLYLRLSREKIDPDSGEKEDNSISIGYQRDILTKYAIDNGYEIYNEYMDDGQSGVKFNKKRNGFFRMIDDIEQGHVNMVLSKDLDRFGALSLPIKTLFLWVPVRACDTRLARA